ncbi:hypothetical protein CSOJ01_10655 [Colletotrichum sojae]|uniref:Uncharacterized protein n=1 Tax=Colletotrichum sojae TaxID=2175907 RepID=A0A8H6IZL3_9PEZI|nr:hypothetical protein CSOJ01_10655 [Colletotrichum sojae]
MKKNKKVNRLSDVHRHPPRPRARGQDRRRGRDHHCSLYSKGASPRPPSLRTDREQPEKFFTLGRRGYQSSTRVGSVASSGNQEEVEYYRNDSPVGGGG